MTPISESDVLSRFNAAAAKVRALFPDTVSEEAITNLEHDFSFDSAVTMGQSTIGYDIFKKKWLQKIYINKHIQYEELSDLLDNNIYHELCHFVQNEYALKMGIYHLDSNGRDCEDMGVKGYALIIGTPGMGGHSYFWKTVAKAVSEEAKLALPITATVPEFVYRKHFLEPHRKNDDIICSVECLAEDCDYSACVFNIPQLTTFEKARILDGSFIHTRLEFKFTELVESSMLFMACVKPHLRETECPVCFATALKYMLKPGIDLDVLRKNASDILTIADAIDFDID